MDLQLDLQLEIQLQKILKTFKADQTGDGQSQRALTKSEIHDILRKVSSNPIQLDDPKLSDEQKLLVNDLSKLELSSEKAHTGSTCHPTSVKHFDLIKTIFPEILRSVLVVVWLLAPMWRSIVSATHVKIGGNNPDPDIASSFVKGADVHPPSESSGLENFLNDLEDLPHQLQQTFLNQLISGCVLRLESHHNSDLAVCNLQKALGEDVYQDIHSWLDRLQWAVYRVSQRPLHPLLSSFTRRDLAQRTVELLQKELDNVKALNDIPYQQAPIPPTMIQLTGEQEQQLWDLGVGIHPSVNKRAHGAIRLPQKEVDWIIKKAREYPSFQPKFYGVDMSQVCNLIFCRIGNGLTPEKLKSLTTFVATTLQQFPILASTTDYAIAEWLYLLWFTKYPNQHYDRTHLDIAQNLFKVLPDRLQHAQPKEITVVIFLGLRTVAHIFRGDSNRPLAVNPYVAFCSLMGGSPLPDKEAVLDRMCSCMLAELRQLEDVDLERFAIYFMGGTEADGEMSLPRSYCQYRLANPPIAHEEATRHFAKRMAVDSWQAHQGFRETEGGLEETVRRDAAQI